MKIRNWLRTMMFALLAAGTATACAGGKQRSDDRTPWGGEAAGASEPDTLTGAATRGPDVAQAAPIDAGIRDAGGRDAAAADGGIRDAGTGGRDAGTGGDGGIGGVAPDGGVPPGPGPGPGSGPRPAPAPCPVPPGPVAPPSPSPTGPSR